MSSTETRLDEAVRQTTLAETELLLQMGRLDLAEKVKYYWKIYPDAHWPQKKQPYGSF